MALSDDITEIRRQRRLFDLGVLEPGPQTKAPAGPIRSPFQFEKQEIFATPKKEGVLPERRETFISKTIKEGLLGDPKQKEAARRLEERGVKVPLRVTFRGEGLLPFLGKTNVEKMTSRQKALEKKGVSKERASEVAFFSIFARQKDISTTKSTAAKEGLENLELTGQEKRILFAQGLLEKGGELLDITTFGIGAGIRKPLTKITQRFLKGADIKKTTDDLVKLFPNKDPVFIEQAVDRAQALREVGKKADEVAVFFEKEFAEVPELIPTVKKGEKITARPAATDPADLFFEPRPVNTGDKVLIAVQDKLRRLDTTIKAIKKGGVQVSEEADALTKARLFTGKATDRINRVRERFASKNKNSLLSKLTKENKSVDDFGDFLQARHARERNIHVANINKKLQDGGSGLTNKAADDILEKLKGKGFDKFAKQTDELRDETLDVLQDAGILSRETRTTIEGTFENYVPLKIESKKGVGFGGSGFSVGTTGIKRIKGSTKERVNPFIQLLVDHENAIVRAEKNKVGLAFLQLVRENPNPNLWKVRKQSFRPHFTEDGEFILAVPRLKAADDVFEVWEDGQLLHIEIKDEELARAMKNLGQERFVPLIGHFNNYLRAVVTTFNPEFVISNFERDIQTALINITGEREKIKDAGQVLKNIPFAAKGIVANLVETSGVEAVGAVKGRIVKLAKGDKTTQEWAKLYAEFKEEGAKVGWIDARDVTDRAKEVESIVKRQEGKTLAARMAANLEAIADYVEAANETVESSTRLAAYKAMKDAGKSSQEAALIARDLTVDFNKKGNLGTMFNSFYLFANAGVQGGTKIVTVLFKSRLARRITAGIAGGTFALSELNRQINEESYRNIPDYIKDTNTIIMLGNGKMILLRSPYGYNVFGAMGTIANDVVHKDITTGEAMKRLLLAFDAGFNPLGSGSIAQFLAPSIADPIIQVSENKNFAGNPITPHQFPGSEKPDSQLYFSSVREVSQEVAEAVNKMTGGTEVESGKIDISPEVIDHWIDFIGGGVGKFIANTMNTGVTFARGEMPSVNNMPIIRKFMYENNESSEKYSIFDLKERSRTNELSEIELRRLKRNFRGAVDHGSDGTNTMTMEEASRQMNIIMKNQARLKAQRFAENLLNKTISKKEAKEQFEKMSPLELKELQNALERVIEE